MKRGTFAALFCTIVCLSISMPPKAAAAGVSDKVIHQFGSIINDGVKPTAGLVQDGTTLYGVTTQTESSGYGTIFKINADGSGYQILHNFGTIANDGETPAGSLTLVGSTLYGLTSSGGPNGYYGAGTIFKINTDGTGYQILYDFGTAIPDALDPVGALTLVGSTLYGASESGGGDNNENAIGAIFKINTDGSGYQVIHFFGSVPSDGSSPGAGLAVVGSNLYGTTPTGGASGNGTVFEISPDGSSYNILYNFNSSIVGNPYSPETVLTPVGSTLFGTTFNGGAENYGAIYQLDINGSNFQVDHNFGSISGDGLYPESPLTVVGTTLYGSTINGGAGGGPGGIYNPGAIFKINVDGSGYETVYSFKNGTLYKDADGPGGNLTLVGSTLYGTSSYGGINDYYGTIFSLPVTGAGVGASAFPEGRYTLLITSSDAGETVPSGTGYATMTVNKKGAVVIGGKLADGESFSTSGKISGGDQLVVNKSLIYPSVTVRGTKGLLTGSLTFAMVTGTSDLSGTFEWIKPQQKKGDYPAPIETNLNVIGSLYTPPGKKESVLPGFTTGTLTLSDTSGLIVSGTSQLTAANKLTITDPSDKLKVTITRSTGVFKGTFTYPIPGKKPKLTDFAGVLFQDQINGGGLFLGPDGSGIVSLTGT